MKRSGNRHPIHALALSFWIVLLWLPFPSPVKAHDPDLSWATLSTPHFDVHYHQGTREFAARAAQAAEKAYFLLSSALEHTPTDKIQIVVSDQNDPIRLPHRPGDDCRRHGDSRSARRRGESAAGHDRSSR